MDEAWLDITGSGQRLDKLLPEALQSQLHRRVCELSTEVYHKISKVASIGGFFNFRVYLAGFELG